MLTASTLIATALLASAAVGQQPAGDKKAPAGEKGEKKAPDPTDAAIAAALANDAEVKMARAKVQLAEAELAKARQGVTLKVVTLKAKIEQFKGAQASAEVNYGLMADRAKAGVAPQSELNDARDKLGAAKSALALAEAEWRLLVGPAPDSATAAHDAAAALREFALKPAAPDAVRLWNLLAATEAGRARAAVKGPIPDRIRAALDKPVKLGPGGRQVTLAQALEVFKAEAGLNVPVRGALPTISVPDPKDPNVSQSRPVEVASGGEELPVGAWFQLFEDSAAGLTNWNGSARTQYRFYVREYGLLIASTAAAPPDAPTLTDFWKQKPAPAKDTKLEPAPKK